MAYETITYEVAEQILTITLNRPDKLNAFNATMQKELIDAFDQADSDDNVRAIIVTGAGRGFCAGADLSSGGDTFDRDAKRGPVKRLPDGKVDYSDPNVRDGGGQVTLRIFKCLKPVIAAVNGPAVGIGVTMQLAMDIRIASENAQFGFVFSQRGIVPEAASSWFLPRIAVEGVGAGRKVGAGAEPAPRAGDDDGANVVVPVGLIERLDQFLLHKGVEGIELVGPVQRDGEDLLGNLVEDGLIGHGVSFRSFLFIRHGRACPGHPRLPSRHAAKTWMPGTTPGMTGVY